MNARTAQPKPEYVEKTDGEVYFKRAKDLWQPVAGGRRIIPLCTPLIRNSPVFVIGTNHSYFSNACCSRNGRGEGSITLLKRDTEADAFTRFQTERHLYVDSAYDHINFVKGLRKICAAAGVAPDRMWMGANRCSVQTGPGGVLCLRDQYGSDFDECQNNMDRLLNEVVAELQPRLVIRLGKYASNVSSSNYPNALVLDLHHPSQGCNFKKEGEKLRKAIQRCSQS